MRRFALTLALLACSAGPVIASQSPKAANAQMAMDRTFQRLGNEFIENGRTDGLSIAVVKDGKAHFYNFGSTTREKTLAPTERSVYEIGSITKIFTSLVLAHAVSEGKVGLQDDIRRYLPGEYLNLAYQGTPVRVVDLANTTSALPDNLPNPFPQGKVDPDKAPFMALEAMKRYTDKQLYEELKTASLSDKPGTAPRHSNLAADLLAKILEKVYGEPYETLIARYIEKPFGMATGTGRSRAADEVNGYNKRQVAMPRMYDRAFLAAGGLRYSTADMAKFLTAELAATDPAIRLSQQPAWGDPDNFAVGLNWTLSKTVDSKPRLRMSGSTFGCSSYIEMYPAMDYGIILLANRPGETQNEMQELASKALEEIWGKPPALAALEKELQTGGYRNVSQIVAQTRGKHPELHLTEDYVNVWGYRLLADKPQWALGLFQYNAEQWPKSWNAFDSLAEAYEKLGDVERAIANYKRSLVLDAANKNAVEHLQKLEQRSKDRKSPSPSM